MSMSGPEFIDNRDGNTLAKALARVLGGAGGPGMAESGPIPKEVSIASAFFSPEGFARIADNLAIVPSIRLMIGAEPPAEAARVRRKIDQTPAQFEQRQLRAGLHQLDEGLRAERDHLPFTRASAGAVHKLIGVLRAGNMAVRRYDKAFLHAKAYIFAPEDGAFGGTSGVIVGSSNLTASGMTRNLELNLGRYDHPVVGQARDWFDDLWQEAEPFDLAELFEEIFTPHMPWEVFLRVLWQLYGDEVEKEAEADRNLPLTSFQKHGVARALRLLRECGGVIVADEVGLGKTFIAGEIIQLYRERRQRCMLVCPAALRDSTWKKFIHRFELYIECLSFEELANDIQLKDPQRPHANQVKLQRALDEYQLVIVDEAHNYRNPDAPTRAAVLRRLLFGRKRDLLLLTATPVNNSLWDLYHLIRFFLRQDSYLADRGILSIRERFEWAMREDPSSLNPDMLYPIIDATTVKRTRQFVKRHYANDTIVGPDGRHQPIVFPHPRAITVRYNLDDALPGFFDQIEVALDPDDPECISFARYMPDIYRRSGADEEDQARARAGVGLLRSGLLKRFESSAYAFRNTVAKMAGEHQRFLDALDQGKVITTAFLQELSGDDEAAFEDLLELSDELFDVRDFDVESLRAEVKRDRDKLVTLAEAAGAIAPEQDPKLQALRQELIKVAEQAAEEATDAIDEIQKRKVLVFSFFEDTVKWIRDYLATALETVPELAAYKDRFAVVSGSGELSETSRQRAVHGFTPVSSEAPPEQDDDLYDLLIATDVLAEGVNLQQCRNIINYDMPWNPMRLVQRHGRIDRIGSPHKQVFLRTIFPTDRLDQLLNLEQRILNKLAMAAASVGVAPPIEGAAHGRQVFSETREEIEKLLKEDSTLYERGGTAGAAQTGEEYRQTLRKALLENKDAIVELPWKSGSGMAKGDERGVFFCAAVGDRTYLRFVCADDGWGPVAEPEAIVREIGTCLRLIECTPDTGGGLPEALSDAVYDFWGVAQNDIWNNWMHETDPANLQPKVRPLNHRVAEFIRANTPVDMSEERIQRALDILESPWPRREEIMLRGWFDDDTRAGVEKSQHLVEQILETGLEPLEPPPVLPPIQKDDIELICWMALEPEDGEGHR